MTQIEPKVVDLLQSLGEPSPPGSLDHHFKELETNGKTAVDCPYGTGFYVVKVHGSHWYQTPELIYCPNEKCPYPYNQLNRYPSSYSTSVKTFPGRAIPIAGTIWGDKTGPYSQHAYRRYCETPEEYLTVAKQLVRVILSGSRLYEMECGDIASANNSYRE